MKKTYRLTIDVAVNIDENLTHVNDEKKREYLRQLMAGLRAKPNVMQEFFKERFCWGYFAAESTVKNGIWQKLKVKNEEEILAGVFGSLSPEAAGYFGKILSSGPVDDDGEDCDDIYRLINDHLDLAAIADIDFREVDTEDGKGLEMVM